MDCLRGIVHKDIYQTKTHDVCARRHIFTFDYSPLSAALLIMHLVAWQGWVHHAHGLVVWSAEEHSIALTFDMNYCR